MQLPLSVVVVAFDMGRELPRTVRSLDAGYQRDIDREQYEIVVVDNGSPEPLGEAIRQGFHGRMRIERLAPASSSPVRAANLGLELAEGNLIGLLIDGARMASPGLLAHALLASRLAERPVIATLAWHLGPVLHMNAGEAGYDQVVEDALLARVDWEEDGYRLFDASVLAASCDGGWFGPIGESNALFLTREMWSELGGLDERFSMPGGGMANHDLFSRACALDGARLIVLLGEGTFHQIHGGAATSRPRYRVEAGVEYEALRHASFSRPANPPLYVGTIPRPALPHVEHSVRWALSRAGDRRATGGA